MKKFRKISYVHICILSSFIFSVKSIKLTSIIHNWNVCEWNIQLSSYFDTCFKKKIGQILHVFGVEMDRQRRGYTSSWESGMESILWRYLFFVCLVT